MKKLTREEIEKQDSYAVASIIDYWKEYEKETVILAYITLLERNEAGIVEGRKFKFDKFSKHYGIKSLDILGDYVNKNPHWEDSRVMGHAENILNKRVYQYDFKKLGIITNILGYLIGFVFVLTLLTIAGPVGVIVGLTIYFLGFKFANIGFLIYNKYKSFVRNEITFDQFRKGWENSFAITIIITIFFTVLCIYFIGHLRNEDNIYLYAILIVTLLLGPLIPNYLLLFKLKKQFFKPVI